MPDASLPPFMRRWRDDGTSRPSERAPAPETTPRRAVSRPVGPNTLQLPAIPPSAPRPNSRPLTSRPLSASDSAWGTPPDWDEPYADEAPTTAPPPPTPPLAGTWEETALTAQPAAGKLERQEAATPYPVTILPGSPTGAVIAVRPPPKRQGAHRRIYRFVLAGVAVTLAIAVLTVVPLNRVVGTGGYAAWLASAAGYELPTATPTPVPPTPTPVIYPSHPVVSGVGNFICTALPFARLAQDQMLQAGMAHPWHTSMILAQWALEQGWSIPGYTGYNWGNVGSIPGYPTVGGLNVWGSPSAFAYAYTPRQGVEEYVYVAQNGYYDNVTANWNNGPRAQAYALGQSPWDAAHYNNGGGSGSSLVSVMNAYNLYQYDNAGTHC